MNKKLLATTLILLFLNLTLFLFRDDSFKERIKSNYFNLYYPEHLPKITGFQIANSNQLKILLDPIQNPSWTITSDSQPPYQSNHVPIIDLLPSDHTYKVFSSETEFELTITWTPAKYYSSHGQHRNGTFQIIKSTIPIGNFKQYPLRLTTSPLNQFSKDDINKAHAILLTHDIHENQPTLLKIKKIGTFLLNDLDIVRGTPTSSAFTLSPLQLYLKAKDKQVQLWCANFASIYNFFATVANIPTRIVTIGGSLDGVQLNAHGFCESFVNESHEWVYVDLYKNNIYTTSADGKLMNSIDLLHSHENHTYKNLISKSVYNGELIEKPYPTVQPINFNTTFNSELYYPYPMRDDKSSLMKKASHYLHGKYLVYSFKDLEKNNFIAYLKVTLFYSFIASAFILLGNVSYSRLKILTY